MNDIENYGNRYHVLQSFPMPQLASSREIRILLPRPIMNLMSVTLYCICTMGKIYLINLYLLVHMYGIYLRR